MVFEGSTGSGKTFLSNVKGREACKKLLKTRYIRLPDLLYISDIEVNGIKGNARILERFGKYDLLIIAEWLLKEKLTPVQVHFLLELIERRYQHHSTIFCTQYKQEDWNTCLGSNVHSEAIIDRIIHNKINILMGDVNMRKELHL